MNGPSIGDADAADPDGAGGRAPLAPSRFGAGYTVGGPAGEPPARIPVSGRPGQPEPPRYASSHPLSNPDRGGSAAHQFADQLSTASPVDDAQQVGQQSSSAPIAYPRGHQLGHRRPTADRRGNGVVAAVVAVILACGGAFLAGRLTAPKPVDPAAVAGSTGQTPGVVVPGAPTSITVPNSSPPQQVSAPQCSADATDGPGDTKLMYTDRGEYNRADIVALRVLCADDQLTVTLTFAPGVDMSVAGFAALIDRDPDAGMQGGHTCDGSDTYDLSISVDGGARGNSWSVLDTTSCQTPYPVIASGASTTVGSSMAATVPFANLGIRHGDTISLYAFSSTYLPPNLLDPGQDTVPDGRRPLRIQIRWAT